MSDRLLQRPRVTSWSISRPYFRPCSDLVKELKSPFDNLPFLSQEEALKILSTPVGELELTSDYYKAAFHLGKFPGAVTEQALLYLVESTSNEQPVVIARKKAIEGLARLRCVEAIPAIGSCLSSSDPYLVETSAWALQELDCQDPSLHQVMTSLLEDPNQHRRVLIQSLTSLGVVSALPSIERLQDDASPGVSGAAMAAVFKLCGQRQRLAELKAHLTLPIQVDRHLAIQDVINTGDVELLKAALSSPVSPTFRMRALNALWPKEIDQQEDCELLVILDGLIADDPGCLELIHSYGESPTDNFLVEELFRTDFSCCYLAVQALRSRNPEEIWPVLWQSWERAKKDYGAIYFFILLFRYLSGWPQVAKQKIQDFILMALDKCWPDFIKFKPMAILTLMQYNPRLGCSYMCQWLDPEKTPYWASRYAALQAFETFIGAKRWDGLAVNIAKLKDDPHRFVRIKAKQLELKYLDATSA